MDADRHHDLRSFIDILYAWNIEDEAQLATIIPQIRSLNGHPLLCIDEEGGKFFSHLITTLSFARARSRSEVRTSSHFTHLITTFLPLTM